MYKIAEICLNKGRLCVEKKGKSDEKNKENIETRQVKPKNNLLRDLIQILILKR